MSESQFEAKVEDMVETRLFNRTLSPAINRLLRMKGAELEVESVEEEAARIEARKHDCTCYPTGFISWSKEVKAEQKRLHIEAGRHSMWCPMWRDPSPMYSRDSDSPPSYTQQQRRRDEEIEQDERRSSTAQRRFSQVD